MEDIHWKSGVSYNGIPIPTYGNYGGPSWSEGRVGPSTDGVYDPGKGPIDALDTLFFNHDYAAHLGVPDIAADKALLDSMVALTDRQLDAEASLYSGLAELAMINKLAAEGYHFSSHELYRDVQDAVHNIGTGLAGLRFSETLEFGDWAAHTGGALLF